jgi:hypothetical protein
MADLLFSFLAGKPNMRLQHILVAVFAAMIVFLPAATLPHGGPAVVVPNSQGYNGS